MRILVHDFGGYPFPAELSRELAERGHCVTHSWCASLVDTPGSARAFSFPHSRAALVFSPIDLREPLDKYRYVKRLRQEREYGRLGAELIEHIRPDVVLAANVPLDAQSQFVQTSKRNAIPFVFWLQDLIGPATENLLRQRLPVIGRLIGRHYTNLEARLLRSSSAVVPVSADFRGYLDRCGVDPRRVTIVENWAPLADLPLRPKDNPWAIQEGLAERFVFLYTGALGMKQDPELLLDLASCFRDRDDVRVVVHSGGPTLGHLAQRQQELRLPNLVLRDFVSWERLPDLLGAADVLVASIHRGAGKYSVPSKVMSYLCAGRPLMVSVPADNLAGKIVSREGAGLVIEPGDRVSLLQAAERLYASCEDRATMGLRARRYAESSFEIGPIAERFESILTSANGGGVDHA